MYKDLLRGLKVKKLEEQLRLKEFEGDLESIKKKRTAMNHNNQPSENDLDVVERQIRDL